MIRIYTRMTRIKKFSLMIILGSFGLIVVLGSVSFAQENDLFLVVSPTSPAPDQNYSVEARSFQFDTSRAYFEWFKDSKKIDEGTGIVKKIFGGEKLGSQSRISVSVSTDGNFYKSSATIGVNDIDFIINPRTYIPPFYRGRALPTPGSIVETYAIPHIYSQGSRISAQNLIFEWKLDGKNITEQSGRGKNKLVFSLPKTRLGENEILIKISSLNGVISQEKTERVIMQRPEIVLYSTSSLLGKSAVAVSPPASGFETKSGEEFSIVAEPFFFDLNSLLRATFLWLADGAKISTKQEKNPFLLELSSQPGTESENDISFKIGDEKNVFQKGEGKITVKIKP